MEQHNGFDDAAVHGYCDSAFAAVREVFTDYVSSGDECGAALCVDLDGRTVVDLWGGWSDSGRRIPWRSDTITNVFSTTKTITALAALVLIDRGLLDPFSPVSRYWPEFAAAGKESVEVRHILSHTSGVSGWEQPITFDVLFDTEQATTRLARQEPWWTPGSASGYHVATYGYLVGELVRRQSGQSLTKFIEHELARPLGADFQLGARRSDWDRISDIVPPPPVEMSLEDLDPRSPMFKTYSSSAVPAELANSAQWRTSEIGASNGHSNARGLVSLMRAISLGGTAKGHTVLSRDTVDSIFEKQSDGVDLVLGVPMTFGLGYGLSGSPAVPFLPEGRTCFWSGWGGSIAFADVDRRLTVGYAMNKMGQGGLGSERTEAYVRAITSCVD